MDRFVGVQFPETRRNDRCLYCGSTDCAGHPQETARSFYTAETARLVRVECSEDEGDEPCPYCGDDCAGHDPEDAESFSLGKFSGWVSMDLPSNDGDDPCPYCGSSDCAGHAPEDAGSFDIGKMARWVAMGDDLPEPAMMFHANVSATYMHVYGL